MLWDANAVRLRRVELGAALQTLLDPLGRPLTVSGGDGLPAVRSLCWLEPAADPGTDGQRRLLVATARSELLLLPVPAAAGAGAGAGANAAAEPLQRPHTRRRARQPAQLRGVESTNAGGGGARTARGGDCEPAAAGAWAEAVARRHAVAAHPHKMRFASVGPDGFARLWGVPEAGGGGLQLLALQH